MATSKIGFKNFETVHTPTFTALVFLCSLIITIALSPLFSISNFAGSIAKGMAVISAWIDSIKNNLQLRTFPFCVNPTKPINELFLFRILPHSILFRLPFISRVKILQPLSEPAMPTIRARKFTFLCSMCSQPEETNLIAESAGLFTPEVVARKILSDASVSIHYTFQCSYIVWVLRPRLSEEPTFGNRCEGCASILWINDGLSEPLWGTEKLAFRHKVLRFYFKFSVNENTNNKRTRWTCTEVYCT